MSKSIPNGANNYEVFLNLGVMICEDLLHFRNLDVLSTISLDLGLLVLFLARKFAMMDLDWIYCGFLTHAASKLNCKKISFSLRMWDFIKNVLNMAMVVRSVKRFKNLLAKLRLYMHLKVAAVSLSRCQQPKLMLSDVLNIC